MSTGAKVIVFDTDHGMIAPCGNVDTGSGALTSGTPWRLFTRGVHFVTLDYAADSELQTLLKTQMGQAVTYANKMGLKDMLPVTDTSIIGTGFGLKHDCVEYLSYRGTDGSHTIDLSGCSGSDNFAVEYLDIVTDGVTASTDVLGGASCSFNPSGSNPTVVYLKLSPPPADTTPSLCLTRHD